MTLFNSYGYHVFQYNGERFIQFCTLNGDAFGPVIPCDCIVRESPSIEEYAERVINELESGASPEVRFTNQVYIKQKPYVVIWCPVGNYVDCIVELQFMKGFRFIDVMARDMSELGVILFNIYKEDVKVENWERISELSGFSNNATHYFIDKGIAYDDYN